MEVYPICQAGKNALVIDNQIPWVPSPVDPNLPKDLTPEQLIPLLSNLAKGCEKQYRTNKKELFQSLSDYYDGITTSIPTNGYADLNALIDEDIEINLQGALESAKSFGDQGAVRALAWNTKVSLMIRSLLKTKDEQMEMIEQKGTEKQNQIYRR